MPTKKPSSQSDELSVAKRERKPSIKWAGRLEENLAYKLKERYFSHWKYGNKTQLAMQWASELGIGDADVDGNRTRTKIISMIQDYKVAKRMEAKNGGTALGKIKRVVKQNGQMVEVWVSEERQLEEICKQFKILDSFLGDKLIDAFGDEFELDEDESCQPLNEDQMDGTVEPERNTPMVELDRTNIRSGSVTTGVKQTSLTNRATTNQTAPSSCGINQRFSCSPPPRRLVGGIARSLADGLSEGYSDGLDSSRQKSVSSTLKLAKKFLGGLGGNLNSSEVGKRKRSRGDTSSTPGAQDRSVVHNTDDDRTESTSGWKKRKKPQSSKAPPLWRKIKNKDAGRDRFMDDEAAAATIGRLRYETSTPSNQGNQLQSPPAPAPLLSAATASLHQKLPQEGKLEKERLEIMREQIKLKKLEMILRYRKEFNLKGSLTEMWPQLEAAVSGGVAPPSAPYFDDGGILEEYSDERQFSEALRNAQEDDGEREGGGEEGEEAEECGLDF